MPGRGVSSMSCRPRSRSASSAASMSATRYATWCSPGPRLARKRPTAVSGCSGAKSSTWLSPTSSRTASTPWASTTSRWASCRPYVCSCNAIAASRSSTATPTWSIRANMRRRSLAPGPARPSVAGRRLAGTQRRGEAHLADRAAVVARRAVHDRIDLRALEDLVGEQLLREALEQLAVGVDQAPRGAVRLEGELALLLVADAAREVGEHLVGGRRLGRL